MRCAEVYGRFWKFLEDSQSCKMSHLGVEPIHAVASLLYADMFELYLVTTFYANMTNFHSRSQASLLASRLNQK